MCKILFIHPKDSSTDFLQTIVENIRNHVDLEYQRLEPNIEAHETCLKSIQDSNADLIIFMGHGQSDKLFGAKPVDENLDYKEYQENGFINKNNFEVFSNKKVILISCDSNDKKWRKVIDCGTKVFVGFGYIPTDWIVEVNKGIDIKVNEVDFFNEILTQVFSESIIYSFNHNFTFNQFEMLFKIIINKKILSLIEQGVDCNDWLFHSLNNLKDEIRVFGEDNLKFL